ncbi:MAG TPA: 6,7-dimethyl-8-ribityllumazine synthase [Actinobacteria bacterium]|nr:6,7-dimethyl-8-ribityllumazine synthase [Actinomycetota bacterium]
MSRAITETQGTLDGTGMRIGVVQSTFNQVVTDGLLAAALETLDEAGVEEVLVARVPGAFELPIVARNLAEAGFDGVVAIGAVVKGETDHYEFIAAEAASGLARVMLDTGVPVGFGVLTVRDPDHAYARSAPGGGNKGHEAAEAVVRTVDLLRRLRRLTG